MADGCQGEVAGGRSAQVVAEGALECLCMCVRVCVRVFWLVLESNSLIFLVSATTELSSLISYPLSNLFCGIRFYLICSVVTSKIYINISLVDISGLIFYFPKSIYCPLVRQIDSI